LEVKAVDVWRRLQSDWPNRSEAIRRLIAAGLVALAVRDPLSLPEPVGQSFPQ
jgi:Mn-dependent DtxR family transcriptional regulator